MACGATLSLKRSLEYDPVHSPHQSTPKRRCVPITMSPSVPPTKCYELSPSPFVTATPKITAEQIAAHISAEVKRLQHRRQLHYVSNASPSSPPSPQCVSTNNEQHADLMGCGEHVATSSHISSMRLFSALSPSKCDAPLFTFRQVSLVCERMLKEHEEKIREQYESVLTNKLAEQYEAFLKFNHDQLHRRFGETAASYVS